MSDEPVTSPAAGTGNGKILQAPDKSTQASALLGAPAGILILFFWQRYMLRPGEILDPITSGAIMTYGAIVFGEVWQILKRVFDRFLPPLPKERLP